MNLKKYVMELEQRWKRFSRTLAKKLAKKTPVNDQITDEKI